MFYIFSGVFYPSKITRVKIRVFFDISKYFRNTTPLPSPLTYFRRGPGGVRTLPGRGCRGTASLLPG